MSRGTRWFLGIAGATALIVFASVGIAAAAVYRAGTIEIDVREASGAQVSVAVPAGLAHLAIALIPRHLLAEVTAEAGPLWPAARTGLRALEDSRDFVLLEIDGDGRHVRVERRGRRMIVGVEEADATVRVAVPLTTVRSVLEKLAPLEGESQGSPLDR